jgi:anti-sigma regulatory factor (Ser/Thr protein kinase)
MSQQATALVSDLGSVAEADVPARSHGTSRHVRLAALPSAVPWARRILRHVLREWHLEGLSDSALLLVSELVTNAVEASASEVGHDQDGWPMVGLTLEPTDSGLLAEVWDASSALPALQEADLTGDRGRGLVLVDFLADSWGHRAAGDGKVVWCTVATPSEPATAY